MVTNKNIWWWGGVGESEMVKVVGEGASLNPIFSIHCLSLSLSNIGPPPFIRVSDSSYNSAFSPSAIHTFFLLEFLHLRN
ncbi:hypothetical protein L6452_09625 [Arctium lappa]|uniref:Uncharacterized protein n=1 Tax=Arctium lappa TaxID=4217 RepID=A0ACB9DLR1_ARCLA|nr:hypothetical protein L6452_09625 [Arctium lappa]